MPASRVSLSESVEPDELLDEEEGAGAAPVARAFEVVVPPEGHGTRLDAWLATQITEYSRSHLQQLIAQGDALIDGAVQRTASRKLMAGQRVVISLRPTAQSLAFVPEPMALDIVFEDAHLLVVNKPAGLVVHPAAGNWQGTLMNGLLAHHAGAVNLPRAGIVHRLDKDTSGLMVVAKTLEAMTALTRAIAAREVSRQYLAITHGQVPEQLQIDAPIGRDPTTRVRMAVVGGGKPARTDVRRLWCMATRSGHQPPWPVSGVLCTLHTGRTHQIRVHLASRGFPLVGDALYGGRPVLGLSRQALHAARLAFAHPVTGEALAFRAELPADVRGPWGMLSASLRQDGI